MPQMETTWCTPGSTAKIITSCASWGISPSNGTPRTIYRNEDIEYIAPFDWSSDGKWIAVDIQRVDRTAQIGVIEADSGALRVLESGEWSGAGKLAFSPAADFLRLTDRLRRAPNSAMYLCRPLMVAAKSPS